MTTWHKNTTNKVLTEKKNKIWNEVDDAFSILIFTTCDIFIVSVTNKVLTNKKTKIGLEIIRDTGFIEGWV
jgi:hypothetical protein